MESKAKMLKNERQFYLQKYICRLLPFFWSGIACPSDYVWYCLPFGLRLVLPALRITDSDYPFGIFKLLNERQFYLQKYTSLKR
jgi:hypothetical protein